MVTRGVAHVLQIAKAAGRPGTSCHLGVYGAHTRCVQKENSFLAGEGLSQASQRNAISKTADVPKLRRERGRNLLILCRRNHRPARFRKQTVLGKFGALVADQRVLAEIESGEYS
jgi:hypothetical protein